MHIINTESIVESIIIKVELSLSFYSISKYIKLSV